MRGKPLRKTEDLACTLGNPARRVGGPGAQASYWPARRSANRTSRWYAAIWICARNRVRSSMHIDKEEIFGSPPCVLRMKSKPDATQPTDHHEDSNVQPDVCL